MALLMLSLIVTCDKEQEENISDSDITTITDEAVASYIFNDVFKQASIGIFMAEQAIRTPGKSVSAIEDESCPDITITPFNLTEWPKTVVLDWGEGCTDGDITRAGKIVITISEKFWEAGSEWSVEPEDFFFQGHLIEGSKTVIFNGRNDEDNLNWEIMVNDAVITTPGQVEISWSSHRFREWINGEQTPFNRSDDEFMITGGSSGVNSAGEYYTITIVEPLNILLSCPWVRSGNLIIENDNRPDVTVDFGDGECNSTITMTVNGFTKEIDLE